jgi:hypothetical protein
MGRKWTPSSSLATSELIERLKKLLDSEARQVPGKGTVVPHNIKLKMQWDKFSDDASDSLERLETELLAAAADYINDSLYYTAAPLRIKVTPDYFVEGVKLHAGFDEPDGEEAELNVTMPAINISNAVAEAPAQIATSKSYIARFEIKGAMKQKTLEFPPRGRLAVGRTGSSDLILDDISVSKIHASLAIDAAGELSVADTGSTNGTFINGERISYGTATRLVRGDRVKFGEVEVEFEPVASETPVEAAADVAVPNAGTTIPINGAATIEIEPRNSEDK